MRDLALGLKNSGLLTTIGELRELLSDEDSFPPHMQIAYSTDVDIFPLSLPLRRKVGEILDAIQDFELEKAEQLMAELIPELPDGDNHMEMRKASALLARQRSILKQRAEKGGK